MANITDQFVTSFSELYIGNQSAVGKASTLSTDVKVLDFFENDTDIQTLTGTATAVAAGKVVEAKDPNTGFSVYFKNTKTVASTSTLGTASTFADFVAADLVFYSAKVPLVMEIGSLSNEATVIDTPTFGEVFKGKLRGQLDGGQLDAQLYWAPRDFMHKLIREYAQDGTATVAGIKWKNDSAGTNSEYVVFDSFVSSFGIDTTFDDVAKASATMVVDGAEVFADDET